MIHTNQAWRFSTVFYTYCALVLTWAGTAAAFEQDHRMNTLTLQFGTNSFATANAFGGAFASASQGQLQSSINSHVTDGSFSFMFEMPGLTDLTGSNVPALEMGAVNAAPVFNTNNPATYSGNSDLDWWYSADPAGLDQNGVPTNHVSGSIVAHALLASASELALGNPLGTTNPLAMSAVVVKATVGSSSAPLQSTNGFPPGHLPGEHIDPALISFSFLTNGQMKGNISAASLAAIPYNLGVATDQGYTSSNSILDLVVSGATTFGGFIRLVYPTQPDQVDTNAPIAGAGPPYRFTANASHMVTGCLDRNNTSVPLATALRSAAYSAYLTFTTDRIIAHNIASGSLRPPALSIAPAGTNVLLTVIAQATATCTIEYKASPADTNWLWLQTFSGTGTPVTLLDSNTAAQTRFYRARLQ
jgi:hypothetical protein